MTHWEAVLEAGNGPVLVGVELGLYGIYVIVLSITWDTRLE